ncbi:MAG TPA: helix-turn-helix transcriptional regulator [Acidimicrobiales bacterium]|nr:helix-turn-helix transcriptional regulator [Acidimicrobiales bacterium]
MPAPGPLGEYLRARRELVDPGAAGLRVVGVRRTPGLRREEVATLAGISADYYLRLEQGRDRNPSRQVLEALARVLRLDEAATAYLLGLGAGAQPAPGRRARREPVPAEVLDLVASLDLPAFVEDRRFDVLAANPVATALDPSMVAGTNRLRAYFLDEQVRGLYPDWERSLRGMVAAFRASIGTDVNDPRTQQLVGELSLASERFRVLWARHDVTAIAGGRATVDHPVVGTMDLRRQKLPIGDTDGQILVIYHAAPATPSAGALRRLAAIASGTAPAVESAG